MKRFALLLAALLLLPATAIALDTELTGTGTGTVEAQPDEGYITVTVATVETSASEALRANTDIVGGLYKALDGFGIRRQDIATLEFNVSDHFKQVADGTDDRHELIFKTVKDGVQVVNTIRVTVCDLESFGKVLDTVVGQGATQVSSITFGVSKPGVYLKKARAAAVKDAVEKAETIAAAFGLAVSEPFYIAEQNSYVGGGGYRARSMQTAGPSGDVPVSGGSLSFSVTVAVKWHLVKATQQEASHPNNESPGKLGVR